MQDTNIYKLDDIQSKYQCSLAEAKEARKLLWYISENIDKLEDIINKDSQEDMLSFCVEFTKQKKE